MELNLCLVEHANLLPVKLHKCLLLWIYSLVDLIERCGQLWCLKGKTWLSCQWRNRIGRRGFEVVISRNSWWVQVTAVFSLFFGRMLPSKRQTGLSLTLSSVLDIGRLGSRVGCSDEDFEQLKSWFFFQSIVLGMSFRCEYFLAIKICRCQFATKKCNQMT